jgi:hypothetical protein
MILFVAPGLPRRFAPRNDRLIYSPNHFFLNGFTS